MKLSQDKNPIILGLILVFTGFLLALFVITRINAADLYDLSQDTPFLISSDYDSSVYGYRVGSGSTSWIREEFGLLYANLNDNNNVSSFTDQITYQVSTSDSWSDSYAVKRGGFNASNFGIVSGSLLTPEIGFIFDNSVEEFHLSTNQWVRVFQCPRQTNYGISQGYYQIYFYDVHQSFMTNSGVDAGRHPVVCFCIPQEHYNDFCLLTDDFDYPYQDYKVFYYDYSLGGGQWVGILPNPFSFEDTYTLAYSDRSVQIRANGNRVNIESMKFSDQVPSPTPSPSPSLPPSPDSGLEFWFKTADGEYYFVDIGYNQVYGYELLSDYPSFVYVRSQYSNYTDLPLLRPAIVETKQSTSNINSYFAGSSVSYVRIYDIGVSYITDSSYIKSSFDYVDVKDASKYNNGSYDIECRLESSNQGSFNLYSFYLRKSARGQNVVYVGSNIASYSFNSSYNSLNGLDFTSGYESSCPVVYGIELMTNVREDPNLPTPTATPTPSPSPTDPPVVIIQLPTSTPSPTPPINIVTSGPMPSWFPPGDPLIPLDPEIQDDVFGNFSGKVSDNAAFGFLGLLMALIPSEAIWFLWFFLFILIVLGIAKVIIHFTGG